MKPEAQRIAIAEACGFACKAPLYPGAQAYFHIVNASGVPVSGVFVVAETAWRNAFIPDYLNDLNAMHEAEKGLTVDQGIRMIGFLWIKVAYYPTKTFTSAFLLAHATAAQRAEAFLRTLGKWVES